MENVEKQVQDAATANVEPDVVVAIRVEDLRAEARSAEPDREGQEQRAEAAAESPATETRSQAHPEARDGEPREEPPARDGAVVITGIPMPEARSAPAEEREAAAGEPAVERLPTVEPPRAGAVGVRTRRAGIEPNDELLAEVLIRAIPIALRGGVADPAELRSLENVLRYHGLDTRAIGIDSTGFVVYEEIARQFTTRPLPGTIGRNHWPTVPMRNVKKVEFPAIDTTGVSVQWGRGGGTPSPSDPAFGSVLLEVDSLEAFVEIRDDAVLFNPAGTRFVQEYVIPGIREALQFNEDKAFFLSNGSSPWSTVFVGLKHATGVTEVAPSTDGDPLTLAVLDGMIKALPPEYAEPSQLAFYLAWPRALEVQEILGGRQTGLGDYFLAGMARDNLIIPPGPRPVAFYRGIPVYGVAHLPTDETVGASNDCSTGFLVHRRALMIGDGGTLRIEPIRERGFRTFLQFQEWVGLGYAAYAREAIVRRPGIRPRA